MEKTSWIRTDLAIESKEMYLEKHNTNKIDGVNEKQEEKEGLTVTRVTIDEKGKEAIGKDIGTYITIYTDSIKSKDTMRQKQAASVISKELKWLLKQTKITNDMHGLIVGLGNWKVTPDSLGPLTVDKTLVTSHLFSNEETVHDGYRKVSAITPGVMGTTGVETSDIVKGIVNEVKPQFVIVIDALAARSVDRLNETVQLSNTGISPGSGVGNKRKKLNAETLGVPVIAIGVPTVVDATTITSDALDQVLKYIGNEWENIDKPKQALLPGGFHFGTKKLTEKDLPDEAKREKILGLVGKLSEDEKRQFIQEVLQPLGRNLMVTPKEVDEYLKDLGDLLATSINIALHERIDLDDAAYFNS